MLPASDASATLPPDDPDLLPDVVVDPRALARHRGFLAIGRRRLAVGAAALCFLSVGIHELPASASTIQAAELVASLQTFETGRAPLAVAPRSDYGVSSYAVVQWPLDPGTRRASGFGHRVAPCAACSSFHLGVDWNPRSGTPIEAIADGTVVGVNSISGDLGVHVVIEHDVDGEIVRSVYGHMLRGSSPLRPGERVGRGELVGRVGNTGLSTGTHLHLAIIRADGAFIDPMAWLRSHVNVDWDER